ncbi:baseplate wedge subunit [Pantoea phage vB_PagM_LIET2]|uniref:Putative baseplate component n=1 Tax=Pantoea phage vB_PagM_LIET2 TaxID=2508071 RepID=A0A411AW80_9CAUD|nr:baseplate wedge subunit [Pantoea phage vB_PagM_LIET2]QAX92346.1 putative baseplate component [Pantoea phage vB_PagM_LIET2]UJH95993.1 baseplate wedge protein [Pantoea phage Nafs113]
MADLMDFRIDGGKIIFDKNGDIEYVMGAERVRQQIEFRLSLWRGTWFLDGNFGTPYLQRILGKSLSLDGVIAAFRTEIMQVEGVTTITRFDYSFDRRRRALSIDLECSTDYGIVKYKQAA